MSKIKLAPEFESIDDVGFGSASSFVLGALAILALGYYLHKRNKLNVSQTLANPVSEPDDRPYDQFDFSRVGKIHS